MNQKKKTRRANNRKHGQKRQVVRKNRLPIENHVMLRRLLKKILQQYRGSRTFSNTTTGKATTRARRRLRAVTETETETRKPRVQKRSAVQPTITVLSGKMSSRVSRTTCVPNATRQRKATRPKKSNNSTSTHRSGDQDQDDLKMAEASGKRTVGGRIEFWTSLMSRPARVGHMIASMSMNSSRSPKVFN